MAGDHGRVRIWFLAISGWVVAAALAVGISWSAINVVRDSVSAGPVVASALPTPDEGGPTTAPSSTPTTSRPTSAPTVGALATGSGQGGTVQARCRAGRPDIVSMVPRQGFQVEADDSGDEVQFRSSDHRTEIKVSCSGLRATVQVEEHSSGGGGDGGGGDNGGGGGNSGRGGGDDN
jgi:hypothetical protein